MRILNCMWSSEAAYRSVHLVMCNFIRAVQPVDAAHWFLIGDIKEQNLFNCAESFNSNKKSTKRLFKRYLLRRRWLKKIYEYQPDVIVVDGLGMARLLLPIIENTRKVKVLIFFHGHTLLNDNERRLLSEFNREKLQLIAVSRTLADHLSEQVPTVNIVAIPTFLTLPPANAKDFQSNSSRRVIFGAAGRLVQDKNFSILIDLIDVLKNKKHDVNLLVAGEGQQYSALQEKILALNLQDEIKLLGFEKDMSTFYNKIDILLIPSLEEGQGLVIQESLHFLTPVICSNLAVFREQLADSGIYCQPDKLEEWVLKCEKSLSIKSQKDLIQKQTQQYNKYNSLEIYQNRCRNVCGLSSNTN